MNFRNVDNTIEFMRLFRSCHFRYVEGVKEFDAFIKGFSLGKNIDDNQYIQLASKAVSKYLDADAGESYCNLIEKYSYSKEYEMSTFFSSIDFYEKHIYQDAHSYFPTKEWKKIFLEDSKRYGRLETVVPDKIIYVVGECNILYLFLLNKDEERYREYTLGDVTKSRFLNWCNSVMKIPLNEWKKESPSLFNKKPNLTT